MTAPTRTVLDTAVGTYPRTEALKDGRLSSARLEFRFASLPTPSRAFAPMVRDLRYDVSELAVATFLQARSAGVPIVLLPVILAARFQQSALLCLREGPVRTPRDLRGRRIGVRAYSQTTAMWLRGILADEFGIGSAEMRWLTFEAAHVAGVAEPANVERAPAGTDLLAALRCGAVDAIIVGNDLPDDPDLQTVFADPQREAEAAWARYGVVPVNHVLTMRADLARDPELAAEVVRMFRMAAQPVPVPAPDAFPVMREPLERAVSLAVRFANEQDMLFRPLTAAEAWNGTPHSVWEVT